MTLIEHWPLQDNAADRLIQPAGGGSLGSEKCSNPDFTGNATGWTLHANISYNSDNVATTSAIPNNTQFVTQTLSLTGGARYLVEVVVDGYTSGSFTATLGNVGGAGAKVLFNSVGGSATATGTYLGVIDFPSGQTQQITLRSAGSGFAGSISRVSVKPAIGFAVLQDGSTTSAITTTGPGGPYPLALAWNGATAHGQIPQTSYTDFTVMGWFKAAAIANCTLFGDDTGTSQVRTTSTTNVRVRINATTYDFTISALSTGTWYNIAVTRSGTTAHLYVTTTAGVTTESSTGAVTVASTAFNPSRIGYSSSATAAHTGADYRIYDAALTESEITAAASLATAPVNTVAPAVTGTLKVNQTLTTSDGTWSDGTRTAIRWLSATTAGGAGAATISGETGETIVSAENTGGKFIRSGVTYTNDDGSTEAFSAWVGPIHCDRFVYPAIGDDSNLGDASAPWATLEHAHTYISSNIGVVDVLNICTTDDAPLYIEGLPGPYFNSPLGTGLTIKSANSEPADIRFYELVDGATAVPFDTYYSSSGHPNIHVLVTRETVCIWEFMGGRGDNLKWFDHLKSLGITPSETFDDATNLSTLNDNAYSWWTGSDGSDFVTLFNPGGDPTGRTFAVPTHSGNTGSCIEIEGGTVENLCIGGVSAFTADGTAIAGSVIQARGGATVRNNVFYGPNTHLGLSGSGASVTWEGNVYREGPRWLSTGSYTPQVWYSETESFAPTHTDETCEYLFSKAGSVRGTNFDGSALGVAGAMGVFILGHGAGVTSEQIVMDGCYLPSLINMPVDATNCFVGAAGNSGDYQQCTFLYTPVKQSGATDPVTISDSVILLNLAGSNSSHYPRIHGEVTIQSSTIVAQDFLAGISGTKPVFDFSAGAGNLTINDTIGKLTGNDGQAVAITYSADIDGTDDYTANRNIFIAPASQVLHASATISGSTANRTLAQMQALGFEADSVSDEGNVATKLMSDYKVSTGSLALGFAAERVDAPDRTGTVFASRTTAGAYELTGGIIVNTSVAIKLAALFGGPNAAAIVAACDANTALPEATLNALAGAIGAGDALAISNAIISGTVPTSTKIKLASLIGAGDTIALVESIEAA